MKAIAYVFIICLLVFGCLNTLATKLTFQMKVMDMQGNIEAFQKPWFGVYRMFQGMAVVILLHLGHEILNAVKRKKQSKPGYEPLSAEDQTPPATPLKGYIYIAVPSLLDLLGTACTYVGLFYNSPSVWQMFRGAMIVFATFFSVTVLRRKLSAVKWLGVALCVLAITVVGCANLMSSSQVVQVDPNLRFFGMGMILLGMLLQGGQVVAEEFLMKGVAVPPLAVVGMEGVWGCILMFAIVFPIVGAIPGDDVGGCMENLKNDFFMLQNSADLQKVVAVYLFSVFTYNIAGMMVTYSLSAVHRTMLEATRTAVIWGVDLAIHAYKPDSAYGEAWNAWSFLQLAGFVLLILGQATYSEILTWGLKPGKTASPIMSPVVDTFSPFSPSTSLQGSGMHSPAGRLELGGDLPEDDTEHSDAKFAITGLTEESKP